MDRTIVAVGAAAIVLLAHSPAWAQLTAARSGPVAYGHHHVSATDINAHKSFWVGALGGQSIKVGTSTAEIVRFPNVLVFLAARASTGGTKGTSVNHVGFQVPNIRAAVDKVKAAGFPVVTRAELPAQYEVANDLGHIPEQNTYVAFVMGPDETKVELFENKAMKEPIALHHIHFAAPDVDAMQAWYAKVFDAKPGMRGNFKAADLPGVNLTYSPSADPVVATRGRALDHIGFEVDNLEAFCKRLESMGIKLDRPFTKVDALNISIAFITDPWGTYIELTEGLDQVP
jgi:catechol 2,3-dioxygenase-like lactoylglutathione lyase family enzyme